jgi:hypothetical protein
MGKDEINKPAVKTFTPYSKEDQLGKKKPTKKKVTKKKRY